MMNKDLPVIKAIQTLGSWTVLVCGYLIAPGEYRQGRKKETGRAKQKGEASEPNLYRTNAVRTRVLCLRQQLTLN